MIWTAINGSGVLVNWRNTRPSFRAATSNSPAISGPSRLERQTACPCRIVQSGPERLTGAGGGAVWQAQSERAASSGSSRPSGSGPGGLNGNGRSGRAEMGLFTGGQLDFF